MEFVDDKAKELAKMIYYDIADVFETLKKEFDELAQSKTIIEKSGKIRKYDHLTKLASSIGYMGQVHAAAAKSYDYEKRLADIEILLKNQSKVKPKWGR